MKAKKTVAAAPESMRRAMKRKKAVAAAPESMRRAMKRKKTALSSAAERRDNREQSLSQERSIAVT